MHVKNHCEIMSGTDESSSEPSNSSEIENKDSNSENEENNNKNNSINNIVNNKPKSQNSNYSEDISVSNKVEQVTQLNFSQPINTTKGISYK